MRTARPRQNPFRDAADASTAFQISISPSAIRCKSKSFGELKPVLTDPPIDRLTPYQTEQIALALMQGNRRLMYDYLNGGSCDCSYAWRMRRASASTFSGNREISRSCCAASKPTFQRWRHFSFPPFSERLPRKKPGLVLVTGATGSGKTTTLAAILNEINETQAVHVVTLEDPIEFVHPSSQGHL